MQLRSEVQADAEAIPGINARQQTMSFLYVPLIYAALGPVPDAWFNATATRPKVEALMGSTVAALKAKLAAAAPDDPTLWDAAVAKCKQIETAGVKSNLGNWWTRCIDTDGNLCFFKQGVQMPYLDRKHQERILQRNKHNTDIADIHNPITKLENIAKFKLMDPVLAKQHRLNQLMARVRRP